MKISSTSIYFIFDFLKFLHTTKHILALVQIKVLHECTMVAIERASNLFLGACALWGIGVCSLLGAVVDALNF